LFSGEKKWKKGGSMCDLPPKSTRPGGRAEAGGEGFGSSWSCGKKRKGLPLPFVTGESAALFRGNGGTQGKKKGDIVLVRCPTQERKGFAVPGKASTGKRKRGDGTRGKRSCRHSEKKGKGRPADRTTKMAQAEKGKTAGCLPEQGKRFN